MFMFIMCQSKNERLFFRKLKIKSFRGDIFLDVANFCMSYVSCVNRISNKYELRCNNFSLRQICFPQVCLSATYQYILPSMALLGNLNWLYLLSKTFLFFCVLNQPKILTIRSRMEIKKCFKLMSILQILFQGLA